jgi:hypothetical protein
MDEMTPQQVEELKQRMRKVLEDRDASSLAHVMAGVILKLETPSS